MKRWKGPILYPMIPQLWWEEVIPVMAGPPWVSLMRLISPETISRASSQLMRSYSETPLFSGFLFPLGSKSFLFIGYLMRSSE